MGDKAFNKIGTGGYTSLSMSFKKDIIRNNRPNERFIFL